MDATNRNGAGGTLAPKGSHSTPPLSAEQVCHDFAPRVYHVARRMLSSDTDAEDVTQDVLLQVVRKLPTFRGDAALPTWLHRITVNAALTHRRKQAVRPEHGLNRRLLAGGEDGGPIPGQQEIRGPDAELLLRETRELIDRAIADLPGTYRTVFVLADVEGLPNAVIGERLGLTLPAVKSRLHRARQILRHALAPHFRDLAACPDAC